MNNGKGDHDNRSPNRQAREDCWRRIWGRKLPQDIQTGDRCYNTECDGFMAPVEPEPDQCQCRRCPPYNLRDMLCPPCNNCVKAGFRCLKCNAQTTEEQQPSSEEGSDSVLRSTKLF